MEMSSTITSGSETTTTLGGPWVSGIPVSDPRRCAGMHHLKAGHLVMQMQLFPGAGRVRDAGLGETRGHVR
jgi:hypothetical protein